MRRGDCTLERLWSVYPTPPRVLKRTLRERPTHGASSTDGSIRSTWPTRRRRTFDHVPPEPAWLTNREVTTSSMLHSGVVPDQYVVRLPLVGVPRRGVLCVVL